MRIEIAPGAADDPDAHRWLDRILHKIDDGWHVWDTTYLADPDEIESTAWIRERGTQGDWVRQILVASIKRDAWTLAPHERRMKVTALPAAADELKPEDGARLAEEPLVILVENRISDRAFVERIVTELDRALHKLLGCPGEPVRFDSLGGTGQMADEIERRTRSGQYQPRLVVIVDSDRKGPADRESREARAVRRKCEQRKVACWVLAKREAENYLPRVLLDARPDSGPDHFRLVQAWSSLNDDQKDFFDMKHGLPDEPSQIERELFVELSPVDREILSNGFGSEVHECWNAWNVQDNAAKTGLLRRGRGDLERGIELIRREV